MRFIEGTFRVLRSAQAAKRSVDPLTRKLRGLQKLEPGWNHGEGVPVAKPAARVAQRFVDIATQLQLRADVFPGIDGSCSVSFYKEDLSVEVVISSTGGKRFGLHVEKGHGYPFTTLVEREAATQGEVMEEVRKLAWKSLGSFLSTSSTQSSVAFQTSSSNTPLELPMALLTAN